MYIMVRDSDFQIPFCSINMKIDLANFSIVVVAQAHNPSILNPDFLINNKIVDASFTPKDVYCTPPISQVSFDEGISIIAEFERLQFVDHVSERIPHKSQIAEIATRYISVLPHVRYTAVGINFTGHYLWENTNSACSFISNKFIREVPCLSSGDGLTNVGLKFIYLFGKIKCTISIESTERIREENKRIPVILINANYNLDVKDNNIQEIISFISDWKTQNERFTNFLEKAFTRD